jgi:citrate lyase subunit beta/citryl-CoA lyase
VWVGLELRDTGGLCFEPAPAEPVRAQASAVLGALGVRNARVAIEDHGAPPFVVAARVETAARRAGATRGDARPAAAAPPPAASARDRLRRSRLYAPASNPRRMMRAVASGADGVILDLEDSVHPGEKDAARLLARNALRALDFDNAERMVRINPLPLGLADLREILPERPQMILIPKVESVDDVRAVAQAIDEQPDGGGIWLMPILENALGVERAFEIAGASERVAAMTIGLEDYAADLRVPRSDDGAESAWARRRVVNAARAAGLQPIDSVFGQVDDLHGLRRWASRARRLGFQGMGCLHPRQVAVIHDAFRPSAAEIGRARRIVEAYESAQAQRRGVVGLDARMIGPPVLRQARRVLELARETGTPEGDG